MALLYLLNCERALLRLRSELDVAVAENKFSRPIIKDAEARQLPYLQAVIKESFRISRHSALRASLPAATSLRAAISHPARRLGLISVAYCMIKRCVVMMRTSSGLRGGSR
jgi:hypothetical protein